MIELIVAVCMIDAPERCKDVTLTFEAENVTMRQCMANGQIALAGWIGEHPNWTIQKWSCNTVGQVAKL